MRVATLAIGGRLLGGTERETQPGASAWIAVLEPEMRFVAWDDEAVARLKCGSGLDVTGTERAAGARQGRVACVCDEVELLGPDREWPAGVVGERDVGDDRFSIGVDHALHAWHRAAHVFLGQARDVRDVVDAHTSKTGVDGLAERSCIGAAGVLVSALHEYDS